jgi:hypothetical protein
MLSGLFNGAKWLGRRLLMRSQWIARRLWVITLAEVAWAARGHWNRLEDDEQKRLVELVRKSKGRSSQLKRGERRELEQLLEKLGHWELADTTVRRSVPFVGGLLARFLPKNKRPQAAQPPTRDASADGAGESQKREPAPA